MVDRCWLIFTWLNGRPLEKKFKSLWRYIFSPVLWADELSIVLLQLFVCFSNLFLDNTSFARTFVLHAQKVWLTSGLRLCCLRSFLGSEPHKRGEKHFLLLFYCRYATQSCFVLFVSLFLWELKYNIYFLSLWMFSCKR